jgi:LPXTG-motif cell wall-anchored protein
MKDRIRTAAAALVASGALVILLSGVAMAAGVSMVDDDFSPSNVTVAVGESVTFTNQGDNIHTATAEDGSFDTGIVNPGSSATVTFDSPGSFPYLCNVHGSKMSGVITVTGTATGGDGGGTGGGDAGAGDGAGGGEPTGTGTGAGTALPQTASPLPLIAVGGGLLLVAGLWLGRRRPAEQ